MPRPTLLTQVYELDTHEPKRTYGELIRDYLAIGNTVPDTCSQAGIGEATFYQWQKRGRDELERVNASPNAKIRAAEAPFVEFAEQVARARAAARLAAVATIRSALRDQNEKETRTESFTEVRLRKTASGEEVPYTYKTERTTVTLREKPGDWRAAIEYLKRRDPDNWSDRIHIDDWRTDAVRGIQAGEIGYSELAAAFGDEGLARQLFIEAGVPVMAEGES